MPKAASCAASASRLRDARSDLGAKPEWDNTSVIRRILELRRDAAVLLGYANYAEVSLVPKMAKDRRRSHCVPARPRASRQAFRRTRLRRTRGVCARRARPRRSRAVGCPVRIGKAQGPTLRVFRAGSAPVFSRRPGAGRALPRGRNDLRRAHPRKQAPRRGIRRCAFSPSPIGRARSSASSISTSTRAKASRAAHGWTTRSTASASARFAPASGRVPHLQPVGAGGRQARDVHARRSHHDLPRIRPWPAPAAHARRRLPASPASTASNGTRSSCPASSWRISAGNGTSSARR